MKKTRNNREASVLPKLQPFFPQEGMTSVANATRGNIPVKLTFEEQSLATLE